MQASSASRAYVSHAENRCAERFDTVLAVAIGGLDGWTRNISSTGICLEIAALPHENPLGALKVESLVEMKLRLLLEGKRRDLLCEGKVLRVDRQPQGIVVAMQLLTPFFAGISKGHV